MTTGSLLCLFTLFSSCGSCCGDKDAEEIRVDAYRAVVAAGEALLLLLLIVDTAGLASLPLAISWAT